MAVKMGEDTSWKVLTTDGDRPGVRDRCYFNTVDNDITISAVRTAPYKYDVTVKINKLSFLWNQMVKTGQMYICLARKKWGRRWMSRSNINNKKRYAHYDTNFIPYTTLANLLGYCSVITPCLYKVVRGKNKYVFHIDFTSYISEISYGNDYGKANKTKWNHTERPIALALTKRKIPYIDLRGYVFRIGTSKSATRRGSPTSDNYYQPDWLTPVYSNDTNPDTYCYDRELNSLFLGLNDNKCTDSVRLEIK